MPRRALDQISPLVRLVGMQAHALRPMHPGSALVLALADWLGLVLNIVTAMDAYWLMVCSCAVASTLGMAAIECKVQAEPARTALLKAALVSALIVLPFPLAGSLAAFGLVIWWWCE